MSTNTILASAPLTSTGYHLKANGTTLGNSLIWDNGTNVGIGNTNTSYTLDVSGSLRATTSAYFATTSGVAVIGATSANAISKLSVRIDATHAIAFEAISPAGNKSIYIAPVDSGTHLISSNYLTGSPYLPLAISARENTSDLYLAINGNVGIGTSVPVSKLQVLMDALYNNTDLTGLSVSNATTILKRLDMGYDGTADIAYIQSLHKGTAYKNLAINAQGGNVGIGTSTPSSLLQVYGLGVTGPNAVIQVTGTTNYAAYRMNNTGGDFYIGIENSTGSGFGTTAYGRVIFADGAYPLIIFAAGIERMRITSGGDVQFGTGTGNLIYNPSATAPALQLSGSTSSSTIGASAYITLKDATNSRFWAIQANASQDLSLWHKNAGWVNVGNFNNSTGIYTPTSNINKKKDFEASTIGLNEVLQLKPTLYRMKADDESEPKQLGFLAQEVEPFIPQAYVESKGEGEDKFIGLNYNAIVAALVKAVQEQNQTIQNLQEQINILAK